MRQSFFCHKALSTSLDRHIPQALAISLMECDLPLAGVFLRSFRGSSYLEADWHFSKVLRDNEMCFCRLQNLLDTDAGAHFAK